MVHPMKKDSSASANAKMRSMTRHYGDADPAMKKLAPVDEMKKEGPEDAVGFGSESANATAKQRGDRPARRTAAANPLSTYKRGGTVKAKKRAEGGDVSAIEMANRNQSQSRARGGRTKHKGTHVNVIVAPQGASAAPAAPPMPPMMPKPPMGAAPPPAGPPGLPPPPMGGPGMGAGPMLAGAPGGMPPGMIPPRARGGKVAYDDAKEDKAMIKGMVKPDALKRARGGRLPKQKHHMTAGAVSGEGRLEKIGKKPHDAGRPQAV